MENQNTHIENNGDYTGEFGEYDATQLLKRLQDKRLVRTHDAKGVALSFGNRAQRRASLRFERSRPKQYHKQGH